MKRFLAFVVGAILISAVVWLGVLSGKNSSWVPWFGIASAVLSPVGIALLTFSVLGSQSKILNDFAKAVRLEDLTREADEKEERLLELESEIGQLVAYIKMEARKQSLVAQRASLEDRAQEIVDELERLEEAASKLDIDGQAPVASEEIRVLRDRLESRKHGDLAFRLFGKRIVVKKEVLYSTFRQTGPIIYWYAMLIRDLQERSERKQLGRAKEENQNRDGESTRSP